MKERYIGIVGSRRRNLPQDLKQVEAKFFDCYRPDDIIVSGGCPEGADHFAERIAKAYGIPILIYYPNWKGEGRSAGFQRNTLIAAKADILIACVAGDRSGGTEDTIRKFKKDELHLLEPITGGAL